MTDTRPDPDALLKKAQEEERQRHRGRLKVFFGANPGVGKTYAMLEAAHEQRRDGVDVVIGVVETHGRAETESLVKDLGSGEALILRNHGALTVGRTVGEAFNWMHRLELACRSQIAAMSCNTPFAKVSDEVLEETWNNYQPGTRRPYGVMEWPALLRKLDRMDPGYRD